MQYILLSDGTRYNLSTIGLNDSGAVPDILSVGIVLEGDTTIKQLQESFSNSNSIILYAERGTQLHSSYTNYNVVNEISVRLNVVVNDEGEIGDEAIVMLSKKKQIYVTQEDYDLLCDAIAEMSEVVYG